MCSYHGGKSRIGMHLASVISDIVNIFFEYGVTFKGYCEPFSGMLGVFRWMPELLNYKSYLAGDLNESVILMWKKAKTGWIPPTKHYTKKEWEKIKEKHIPSALNGFRGCIFSFRGLYFGGYCYNKNVKYSSNKVVEIAKKLKKVKFSAGSYEQFSDLKNYVMYLDPPYRNTSNFYTEKFDYEKFQKWVKKMSKYNLIFISEYSKPVSNAFCVWSKGKEKLYIVPPK